MAAAMIGGVGALWPIGVAADRLGPARAAPWAHGAVALLSLAPIAARGLIASSSSASTRCHGFERLLA
jgi:hypothetical protein